VKSLNLDVKNIRIRYQDTGGGFTRTGFAPRYWWVTGTLAVPTNIIVLFFSSDRIGFAKPWFV